jgi:hypothetical protein
MWQRLVVLLAIATVIACPHQCAARGLAAQVFDYPPSACACCDGCDRDDHSSHPAPASEDDCQSCFCDGTTIIQAVDYDPDFSISYALNFPDAILHGKLGIAGTNDLLSLHPWIASANGSIGRCARLAIQSLQL